MQLDADVELQLKQAEHWSKVNITSSAFIPLRSPSRMGFHGKLGIGTPVQHFNVLFDTGSAEFWVPSISCNVAQCRTRNQFDRRDSSTFAFSGYERFEIKYIKGNLQGDVGIDTVSVGKDQLIDHPFGLADYIAPKSFEEADFDGICGLCASHYSKIRGPTFIEHLKAEGIIEEQIFSFYFESLTKGVLTLGYYDEKYYSGELKWLDTVRYGRNQWEVRLGAFMISKDELEVGRSKAILDSGSNMILMPNEHFNELAYSLNARRRMNHLWEVDCSNRSRLPSISFTLDGIEFTMSPSDYTIMDEDRRCVLSIVPYNGSVGSTNYWILGDPFLRKYYSVFDAEKEQIGLARAK